MAAILVWGTILEHSVDHLLVTVIVITSVQLVLRSSMVGKITAKLQNVGCVAAAIQLIMGLVDKAP